MTEQGESARGDMLARLDRFGEAEDVPARHPRLPRRRNDPNAERETMAQYLRANPRRPMRHAFPAKTIRELGDERIARQFAVRMQR